jgi:two-component system, LytTR family, response regulator
VAVERARDTLARGRWTDGPPVARGHLERLFVRDRGRIVLVPVSAIERIEAQDDYVAVHCDGRAHLVHMTLGELEERLDPARFVRVHRRHLVNLDFVRAFRPRPGGLMDVHVASGQVVPGSRSRSRALRHRIQRQA